MEEDCKEKQSEELEALESIYGEEWKHDGENSYKIQINSNVTLFITLNSLYPVASPPIYELLAPCLSKSQKLSISQAFEEVYLDNVGEPVLFQWIEKLKELCESSQQVTHADNNEEINDDEIEDVDLMEKYKTINHEDSSLINIFHGPTIVDRKSVFQGHISKVLNEQDIKNVMRNLLENKKIAQATHNISAYVIKQPNGVTLQDSDDDGETHAGPRLLHLLQILGVENVLVVVTRWYGGVHLGPDRFRHINNAARQALQGSGHIK